MALSNEEIQFRERIAEFIGTITANFKNLKEIVKKIEDSERDCKKDVDDEFKKLEITITNFKKELEEEIQKNKDSITGINTTIAISKAQVTAYGIAGGILFSGGVWLAKFLIEKYFGN